MKEHDQTYADISQHHGKEKVLNFYKRNSPKTVQKHVNIYFSLLSWTTANALGWPCFWPSQIVRRLRLLVVLPSAKHGHQGYTDLGHPSPGKKEKANSRSRESLRSEVEGALLLLNHGQDHGHMAHQLLDWDKPSCLYLGTREGHWMDTWLCLSQPGNTDLYTLKSGSGVCSYSLVIKPARRPVWWGTSFLQPLSHFYELQLNLHKGGDPLSAQNLSNPIGKLWAAVLLCRPEGGISPMADL